MSQSTFDDVMSKDSEDHQIKTVVLRDYQRNLLEKAIKQNIIVVLPTGSGKTMIAIHLIINKLHQTEGKYPKDAKRTVFLAPTRVLVEQHYKSMVQYVNAKITYLHGENTSKLTANRVKQYWEEHQIIIFTPQVLQEMLIKGYVEISNFNLIVFDEAHWALKKESKISKHPYRQLMDIYNKHTEGLSAKEQPRILGLTASVFNPQVDMSKLNDTIVELEDIYHSCVVSDDTGEYFKEANVFIELSDNAMFSKNLEAVKNQNLADSEKAEVDEAFFKSFFLFESFYKNNLAQAKILKGVLEKVRRLCSAEMGPWFAIEALKMYKQSIMGTNKITREDDRLILKVFDYLENVIERHYRPPGLTEGTWALSGPRSAKVTSLLKLLTIFKDCLNCIVFVTERTDANLLYRWLASLSKDIPEYGFLKLGFICGSPVKDFIHFDKNTPNFKAKFEDSQLNVMIATAVLEEGIDVPICNLVIRYDFPVNFRPYIQSKGRARDADSFYILMTDKRADKVGNWRALLKRYQITEEFIKNISQRSQNNCKN